MTDILVSDLTNATDVTMGISNGSGVFDKVMNTVNLYLDDQYTRGMLRGTDYATVLLGSIQGVLQLSLEYTLKEKLTEAQTDTENENTKLMKTKVVQADKEVALLGLDNVLLQAQTARGNNVNNVYDPYYA